MKVMMVAGDISGDTYGAELARRLREMVSGVRIVGAGGPSMAQAGVEIIKDLSSLSAVGIVESAVRLPAALRAFRELGGVLSGFGPDCLVLIDFPGFNLKFARLARSRGIKTVYFICPTVWAWGRGRAKIIAGSVDRALCIFPFEAEIYREAGADAEFIGHPILDVFGPTLGKARAREALGLDQASPVVALLPGSRMQEVKLLLPLMLQAAAVVSRGTPEATFIWPLAPGLPVSLADGARAGDEAGAADGAQAAGGGLAAHGRPAADGGLAADEVLATPGGPAVRVYPGRARECLEACDIAVVASGTATLEAALLETPMIIVYKVSPLTWAIARRVVKVPYIGLPNILAGRGIVPELLQGEATVDRLSEWILQLFGDADLRNRMREDLKQAAERLGQKGAIERAARAVVEVVKGG